MFENVTNQMMDQMMDQGTAWLLTYALHSTLFLGLAWLAARRLANRWARLEEAIWRFALVAALATATVQLAAGWEPVAGRWALRSDMQAPAAAAVQAAAPPLPTSALPARVPPAPAATAPGSPALPSWPFDLRSTVLGAWAGGALLLSLGWAVSYLRLKRRLRARPEVVGGGIFTLLQRLAGELGLAPLVRLTCSSRVPVPVAMGLGRPEICVPPRALSHLEPEQQEGMLAHELAHLVRRDPFWLAFSRILAGALFFQPLNWLACRRLRELSERLCDEWAVARTGRPLSLARCLAEVAGWSVRPLLDATLPVPSMADRPSSLGRRIRHLLDPSRSPERRVRPVWIGAGMLALLAGVAAVAPGVHAAIAAAEPAAPPALAEPADPADPEAPAAPAAEPGFDIVEDAIDSRTPGDLAEMDDGLERLEAELENLEAGLAPLAELGEAGLMDHLELELASMAFSEKDARELAALAEEISEKYAGEYAALAESAMRGMEPELERISERISEQVNRDLAPEIERISEQVNRELAPEIERISERVANELEPEMERLRAEADRLRREGGLSEAEREQLRQEARELARRARPSEEELAAIRESQQKYRAEMRKLLDEHRDEIEAMRAEARAHSEAMREQIRQRMDADPRYRELRERHRRDLEQIRERHREELRQQREKPREPGDQKKEEKPV